MLFVALSLWYPYNNVYLPQADAPSTLDTVYLHKKVDCEIGGITPTTFKIKVKWLSCNK